MRQIFLLLAIFGFINAIAQDRVLTYTYQTGVLNNGQKEIELWTTLANGRQNFYQGLEHRLEFEVGLGSRLQTAFYLNYGYSKSVTEENGIQSLDNETGYSFSNEWKLKLSDPAANRFGSALYLELTLSPAETGVEGKIILDKQTGKLLNAFNIVGEYERGKEFIANGNKVQVQNKGELNIEFNYGMSLRVKNKFNIGLEAFNQNQVIESIWENSILFLGPSLSYSTNGFWVILTCMPQLANMKGNGLELNDHERLQTRLVFSYEF